jgi:hypothetical protein
MKVEGRVGAITGGVGSVNPLVTSTEGGLVTAGGGKYKTIAMAGRLFAAANQAVVTTVAGATAAAWTGLGLANPTGSGINVIVHQFSWAQAVVATAEGFLALATTTDAGFAAQIAGRNRLRGGAACKAYVDDGVTLVVAGVIEQYVTTISHGAATVTYGQGVNVLTYTDAIQTSGFAFAFLWEELAI